MKDTRVMPWLLALLLALLLAGCPSTREAAPPPAAAPPGKPAPKPPSPELVITCASLDLGRYEKRIERGDLEKLAEVLRRDTVDLLALEGVARYPGLAARIDIPEELAAITGMHVVFGETINLSGRQGGNAVLSAYPVTSSENTHFQGMQGAGFEAALQAVVDCGAGPVIFVSTRLPDRATEADESAAAASLNGFHAYYPGHPVIVSGNLPRGAAARGLADYAEVRPVGPPDAPRFWYAAGGSAVVTQLGARAERTRLGPLVIARFGFLHLGGER